MTTVLLICLGACAGALLRWGLSLGLNAFFPAIPPGTLVANWLGGFLMGIVLAAFFASPGINPAWRSLLITGFLGSLTTFSTFAAEVSRLLLAGKDLLAAAAVALHVGGAIGALFLGSWLFRKVGKLFSG